MAIPDFNQHGLLPPGVHDCSLSEIKAQFCWNPHRTLLFENMLEFLSTESWISKLGCSVLVDGSFVRNKPEPADIDIIIDLTNADPSALEKMAVLRMVRHRELKDRYNLDVWPEHPTIGNSFIDFFQYIGEKAAATTNLNSRYKKGILRVCK